ncbi:ribonuclease H-like domain-containing protein [Tanacetum coccineum]
MNVTVETTETKALVAQDGLGYDWSDQAERRPTNLHLWQIATYRFFKFFKLRILRYLLVLKKLIKHDLEFNLRNKFEKAEKERDDLKLTLEKFENSSKNLSKLLEIQVSDKFKTGVGEDENETEFKSKQRKPSFAKIEFVKSNEHVKIPRESVEKVENNKQAKHLRKNSQSPIVNQRNWNNLMTQKLGIVLMKSGHKTLNTVRQNSSKAAVSVNTARPINTAYLRPTVNNSRTTSNAFNRAHSHVRRPFSKFKSYRNSNSNEKVNTVRRNVITVGSKAVVSDNKGNEANAIKASTWQSTARIAGKRRDPKGGKITGKGKISTGKLDFEDVYFVKELKFNIFSVSQICDKKNSVLFTDTECVVLSPDFKLLNENHVLLRVPRKDNMYSVDLKNIVPSGGLTCLFAKATLDKSNLLHRRLGHINFKTINKLVKGNLVRGLPSKLFEINQTCVACQKGKQHRASCIENLIDLKVKVIRCDNGIEFKNKVMNQFCEMKDHLGKFDRKADEGFFVGYSTNSKAFRFKGSPECCNQTIKDEEKKGCNKHLENKDSEVPNTEELRFNQEQDKSVNNTNNINIVSSSVNTASIEDNVVDENIVYGCADDPNMPNLEEIVYSEDDEGVGAKADMNNLDTFMPISPIPTTRIHKDHPFEQIIGDLHSAPQTRRMTKSVTEHVEPKKVNSSLDYIQADRRFEDPELPDIVYKVEKALYGLHQAPRAWYETLSTYLLDNRFQRDDIIFGSTKKGLCTKFKKMVHKKFQMSSMGELTFFLGLQVTQKDDWIFIIPRQDSPFDLEAYTDSDYACASLDRKSTPEAYNFLENIIFVAMQEPNCISNSTTQAEYVRCI